MINRKAFHTLNYGMYLIQTKEDTRAVGCVANTFAQLTSTPFQVSVTLNKENITTQALLKTKRYVATCLSQDATMELIGTFGFHSSADTDKFIDLKTAEDASGLTYVTEQAVSYFSVKIVNTVDVGTHILFIGEVEEADVLSKSEPMTYAYYHAVKGGKTPPKASSYVPEDESASGSAAASDKDGSPSSGEKKYAWRCTICGYIEYADELPDDYVCPICGMGKEVFERIEV